MLTRRWRTWLVRTVLWLAIGSIVAGASCGAEIRDTLKDAGLSFLGDSTEQILDALIPISSLISS